MSEVPAIRVSCALVERNGAVLACQRSQNMKMPLKWEFPGGKIEAGESPEACLIREVIEELALTLSIREALTPVTYRYPGFTVTLYPFVCEIASGQPTLQEHAALLWLSPEELSRLEWCEADIPIIAEYQRLRLAPEGT